MRLPASNVWPVVHLGQRPASGSRPPAHILDDDGAVILLIEDEHVVIDRRARSVVFHSWHPLSDHDLVHPYLASPAGVLSQWLGCVAVHAGGVVVGGRAWGVLGAKEAGKTTLLAWLASEGHTVLADDLVVARGGVCFAGPRTLDLRPETADRFAAHTDLVSVRNGERSRLLLPTMQSEVPLAGWIVLQEGDHVDLTPVPLPDRLPLLKSQLMMGRHNPDAVLDLLPLPMVALRRPRRWSALPAAGELLLEGLADAKSSPGGDS